MQADMHFDVCSRSKARNRILYTNTYRWLVLVGISFFVSNDRCNRQSDDIHVDRLQGSYPILLDIGLPRSTMIHYGMINLALEEIDFYHLNRASEIYIWDNRTMAAHR